MVVGVSSSDVHTSRRGGVWPGGIPGSRNRLNTRGALGLSGRRFWSLDKAKGVGKKKAPRRLRVHC